MVPEYHVRPGGRLRWVELAVREALGPESWSTWEVPAVVIVCGRDALELETADLIDEIETVRGKIPVRYSATPRTDVRTHLYGIDGGGLPCVLPLVRP